MLIFFNQLGITFEIILVSISNKEIKHQFLIVRLWAVGSRQLT